MRTVSYLLSGAVACFLIGASAQAQTDGEPDYGALFGIQHGPEDGYFAVANDQTVEVFHVNVTELPEAFEGESFDNYIRRNADLRGVWQPIRRLPMEWRYSVMNQGFSAQDSPFQASGFKGRGTFDPTPDGAAIDWSGDEFEIIAAASTYTWDDAVPGATFLELVAVNPPSHQAERMMLLYFEPIGAGSPCYAQMHEGDTTGFRPRPDATPPGDCFIPTGEPDGESPSSPGDSRTRPTAKTGQMYTTYASPGSCRRQFQSCQNVANFRYEARINECLAQTVLCIGGAAGTCIGIGIAQPTWAPPCMGILGPSCIGYQTYCGNGAWANYNGDQEKCMGDYNCCMDSECNPAGEP